MNHRLRALAALVLAAALSQGALAQAPSAPADGAWTIAVLPDTQMYSLAHPEVFVRQTEWLAAHKDSHGIRLVLHEGDIVNNNTHPEWMHARRAMDVLLKAGLPFVMVPGNHDMGDGGTANTRRSHFSDYFSAHDLRLAKTSGTFDRGRVDNHWQSFDTPWGPLMVVALEFGPRDAVVDWAKQAIEQHPDHRVLLLTHAYLYSDGTRYDWAAKGEAQKWNPHSYGVGQDPAGVNDGEELWRKLVEPYPNVVMTLNGHVLNDGAGYLCSERAGAPAVHQILANYQQGIDNARAFGGGGFLRLMRFQPDGRSVEIKTFSPWFDESMTDPAHQFTLQLDAWPNRKPPQSGRCAR